MENKKVIKYSIISLGVSLLLFILYKKLMNKGSRLVSTIALSKSYDTIDYNGLIIIKPTEKTNFNVIYVFGGMAYATPKWMLEQMPKDILLKNMVVLAPYTTSFTKVNNTFKEYMGANNYKEDSLSLIGFSAGALNVQSAYNKGLRFVGLIDPSTKSEYLNLDFGSNAHMIYNNSNWGTYPKIKATQPKIAKLITNGGGNVVVVDFQHKDIPSYFFKTYANKF